MLGILLTKWTIRLSLLGYAAYLFCSLTKSAPLHTRALRWLFTIAGGLFVLHVICAFHFYHHWSHAHAWQTTADETQALLGVPYGDGIYFSYLFLALWAADILWLWLGSHPSRFPLSATNVPQPSLNSLQTPAWRILVHIYLFFIAFHGAIVFEAGPTRPVGIAFCSVLAGLIALKWHTSRKQRLAAHELRHNVAPDPSPNPKTSPELSISGHPTKLA